MTNIPDITIPQRYIIQVSSIHIGVGLSIVGISGFVNAEMKFLGWHSSTISTFFGIAILLELIRLIIGYFQDRRPRIKGYLILGAILSITGLLLIPITIIYLNNPIFIIGIALFFSGSAILTTIVDSYLTLISQPKERNRISGTLQSSRLLGFALGGIIGSITYSKLDFPVFIGMINIILFLTVIITISSLDLKTWKINNSSLVPKMIDKNTHLMKTNNQTDRVLITLLLKKDVMLMSGFLILFSIGLFMQDLILEPFAIAELGFKKSDVGRLVAIWGVVTLIFVPIGSLLEGRIGKLKTITLGQTTATLGMITISISSGFNNFMIFYLGLVVFSIGGGLSSSPAISIMLDLCYIHFKHTAFLLGFFGIIITLGRSSAAIISGVVLKITDDNYSLVFLIETIFLAVALLPIIPISKTIERSISSINKDSPPLHIIPNMD